MIVYLVHGTWAYGLIRFRVPILRRSPRWFEAGSEFRTHLEQILGPDVIFEPFLWSGANTVRARHEAATRLAVLLREEIKRSPERARLVIAHSHGGNVALRAVAMLERPIPIATLATPFLSIRRRPVSQDELDTLTLGRAVLSWLPWLLLIMFGFAIGIALEKLTGLPLFWPLVLLIMLPMLFRTRRLWRRLDRIRSKYEKEWRPLGETVAQTLAQYRTHGWVRRDRLRAFVFRATKPVTSVQQPLLVLRAPRDEASLALTLAGLFAKVADRTWALVAKAINGNARLARALKLRIPNWRQQVIGGVCAGLAGLLLFIVDKMTTPYTTVRTLGIVAAAVLILPVMWMAVRGLLVLAVPASLATSVAPAVISLAGFLLMPFGLELILCGLLAEVRASEVPEYVSSRLIILDPALHESGGSRLWRHSLYDFPAARLTLAS